MNRLNAGFIFFLVLAFCVPGVAQIDHQVDKKEVVLEPFDPDLPFYPIRRERDGKFGFLNKYDEGLVIPFEYEELPEVFSDCMAAKKGGMYGIINNKGEILLPFLYESAGPFFSKTTTHWILQKEGQYGWLSSAGNWILPCKYGPITALDQELVVFEMAGRKGCAREDGVILAKPKYEAFARAGAEKLAAKKDGKWGLIRFKGKPLIPFQYDSLETIEEGIFLVASQAKFGLVNFRNEVLVPFEYDWISRAGQGFFFVKSGDKHGSVDLEGHSYFYPPFDSLQVIRDQDASYVVTYKNGLKGLLHVDGKELTAPVYEDLFFDKEGSGYILTVQNQLYGLMDRSGRILSPCRFKGINFNSMVLDTYVHQSGKDIARKNVIAIGKAPQTGQIFLITREGVVD